MSDTPSVARIGEFALIDRLRRICGQAVEEDILLGIGDDTAVLRVSPSRALLATCDIQVEDVHFRLDHISPATLGRRAMAVNLSDIASMGGVPRYALVSLALPQHLPVQRQDTAERPRP